MEEPTILQEERHLPVLAECMGFVVDLVGKRVLHLLTCQCHGSPQLSDTYIRLVFLPYFRIPLL